MVLRTPLARGALIALLAALCFGVTIPVVARAGRGVGPLSTAALLYLGAFLAGVSLRAFVRAPGARLGRGDLPRVAVVALFGAALAPTLLAWGLQRAGATAGALLLNLEAAFTVLLARALYREPMGGRVAAAVAAMTLGGVALALGAARGGAGTLAGALAVGAATLAWALDNVLTRPLAEHDPLTVVAAKAALGASLTVVLSRVVGEPMPDATRAAILLGCGATGYGLSLGLYLLAQRRIGAGRTASIFAFAPFIGAALGWAMGARPPGVAAGAAGALFALGVYLHVTERHGHAHVHEAIEHEHAHRHDDGHHGHVHDPPFKGEHVHAHRHERVEHDHPHAPDIHHGHRHDG